MRVDQTNGAIIMKLSLPLGLTCDVVATALLRIPEMDEVADTKRKINHLEVGDAFNLANQSDAAPSSGNRELLEAAH